MIWIWDDWNREHLLDHGVSVDDAKFVVRSARSPYPEQLGDDKLRVWGQARSGRFIQVIFALRAEAEIDFESVDFDDLSELQDEETAVGIYLIHAMPMTPTMIARYRKRSR